MARNNGTAWALATELADTHHGYSPRELKAQAMALSVLGYSSRKVERELRRMFPRERIPPWSTIARWFRSRPTNRLAFLRWADVARRAADILEVHLDRLEREPLNVRLMDALKVYEGVNRVLDKHRYYQSLHR